MKSKNASFKWFLFSLIAALVSCSELEVNDQNQAQNLEINSRAQLSKRLLDSTKRAESIVPKTSGNSTNTTTETLALLAGTVNIAPQATVSAESTYPGYSVNKIKDGDRNTTVGPAYSWTNNFPAGGRVPESVFLKFNSLKNISRIDIYTSSGYALQNYTILYRTTSTGSWTTLVTITANTSISRTHSFTAVNALEVQVMCQLGPSNQTIYGRLNEVEIYASVEPPLPSISVESGMLVFNSPSDFSQTIEYLDFKYAEYTDAFVAQYPGKTDDELADIADAVGFNDEQPFINFENQYGIYSLRSQITAAEDFWLATTAGDETAPPDPDDTYMDDSETRTLVNANGQVKVGSTYYVFNSDGSYYVSGGPVQVAALQSIQSGRPLPEGVKLVNTALLVAGCRAIVSKKDKITNGDNTWRFKYKVSIFDGPFAGPGNVKAITKSLRKKNGRWRKHISWVAAQAWGNVVAGDCTGGVYIES